MVITNVMLAAAEVVISFLAGAGGFYLFSERSGKEKKVLLENILSSLINFVLFIWLSKVILNFPSFIKEPLTILAYPGTAGTFYLAFIFSAGLFLYQSKKKNAGQRDFIKVFSFVFLITSLVYELIQFTWNNDENSFGYLLLLSIILIIFLIFEKRVKARLLVMVMIVLWSGGILLLDSIYPVVTVFGYIMRPVFVILFFVIGNLIVFFTVGKEEEHDEY